MGTVKWYNATKGFASALERADLTHLNEGQRVRVDVAEDLKGP